MFTSTGFKAWESDTASWLILGDQSMYPFLLIRRIGSKKEVESPAMGSPPQREKHTRRRRRTHPQEAARD